MDYRSFVSIFHLLLESTIVEDTMRNHGMGDLRSIPIASVIPPLDFINISIHILRASVAKERKPYVDCY